MITGNTVNRIVSELIADGTTLDTRETMTFTAAGTRMTFSRSCASPKGAPVLAFVDFTATPTSLTVYQTLTMGKVMIVLNKK